MNVNTCIYILKLRNCVALRIFYLNLKHIVTSIGYKYNVQVTFVQSHYTSQTCEVCGNIEKDNRLTQEDFKCVCCGHTANADTHSASNIEDRMRVDVLRTSLLNINNGVYTPKKISKQSIKGILAECYSYN